MLVRPLKTSLTLLAAAAIMVGGVLAVSPPAAADDNHKEIKVHAHDLSDI